MAWNEEMTIERKWRTKEAMHVSMISSIYFERFSTLVSLFCRNTLDAPGIFFFFMGGFALQSSLYSASSQPNWYKTDSVKNPAGARILNSREKEGYWKHHCFITMFCYEICFELIKQYRNLLFQEPMRFWLHITKDLTKLRRRRPKSNRFNDQNNN